MGNETNTTTESVNEETSNDSVTSVETTLNSSAISDETSEKTTTTEQPSIDDLQTQIKRIEVALKKANNEAKEYRLKAKSLEDFKTQVEAEKLTDQEKRELAQKNLESQIAELQKQREDAVREKQELRIEHAVATHAQRLGYADPDDAKRFLDMSELEFDDNGVPTNVADLLGSVLKAKPYLKAQGSKPVTSGGATNPPRSTTTANQEINWDYIGSLKPADYDLLSASRRAEINRWMNDPKNYRR